MIRSLLYFCAAFIAMLVNVASRFVLSKWLSFEISVFIAYWSGHIVNFILSNTFVFKGKETRSTGVTFVKFTLVALLGLLVTFFISIFAKILLTNILPNLKVELLETLSHLAGIGCSFIFNYIGHIFFSFRKLSDTHSLGANQ